jgi:hypothetical protein
MNGIIHFLTHLVTQQISTGGAPRFIYLPSHGTRHDVPGSLALSVVLRPGLRLRRRQKQG